MRLLRWFVSSVLLCAVIFAIFFYIDAGLQTKLILYLLLCFLVSLIRIGKGPTPADRAVATDIFGILVIGSCAILAFTTGKDWYMDIAIAWGLQSFIGMLALAKFLEGRHFDE
jgi:multicomponent Na+:H+ antiporter subunit F